MQVEVNMMPGKGEIDLTGQMGDVMKESAIAGLSYVRSVSGQYEIPKDVFKEMIFIYISRKAPCRKTDQAQALQWQPRFCRW